MTESPPVITIEDLPYEILEKIIPDLRPQTISTLRLVNKRFYQLLTNDRYYKSYLHYPEKYYLCEMKNEKNSGKEVIEDIKTGTIGKWKGYLTLENLHLDNLRCGRITRCDIVRLPPPLLDESQYDSITIKERRVWQDRIDEDGEHWLMGLSLDGLIQLANVTNEPKTFLAREIVIDAAIIPIDHAILLPGQVICFSRGDPRIPVIPIVVFNIVQKGGEISLQRSFDFVIDHDEDWGVATGKCESSHSRRNVFVSTTSLYQLFDGVLRFRELNTGNVLDDVNLWDYPCLKRFGIARLRNMNVIIHSNHEEELPYVLISMTSCRGTVVVVFNVDHMELTSFVNFYHTSGDEYCLTRQAAYTYSWSDDFYVVHSIPVEEHRDIEELKAPKLLYSNKIVERFESYFTHYQMLSVRGRFFLFRPTRLDNVLHMITVNGSEIFDVQVMLNKVNCHKAIYSIIGHDVLVVQSEDENNPIKMFKVAMKKDGATAEELIDLKKTFIDCRTEFSRPWLVSRSRDMSKMVYYDKDFRHNDHLAIFHF